jgi:penicillin-insensitive murein DD-endopeptidase
VVLLAGDAAEKADRACYASGVKRRTRDRYACTQTGSARFCHYTLCEPIFLGTLMKTLRRLPRKLLPRRAPPVVFSLLLLTLCVPALSQSVCYGTASHGNLEGAVQLPRDGVNFGAYSDAGIALGRTYLHSKVAEIVVMAYSDVAKAAPDIKYVYGETGWKEGGSFRPHRTHQNGLSIDFFVPVRDGAGRPATLPRSVTNKFGYDIEFDARGKFRDYTIDFDAMAEHLYALDLAAKKQQAPIKQVIFDPPYLPRLFSTKRGAYLKANVKFMPVRAWVRHDEHYHVDFEIACKPLRLK